MILSNIDQFIIYIYLFGMLVLGLAAGRNIKGMKDYAIANRSYSTPIMAITFLATIFGGTSVIGIAESIHQNGIIMIAATSGYILSYLFIARYIAPKMGRFAGMISVGDIMYKFYGKNGKLITGLLGFMFCTGIVAAQCRAMGYLLNATFGFSEFYSIMIGATVLVIYSTFGGVRSVTITDIIQFAILIVVIPLIANITVTEIGGVNELFARVPDEKFAVFSHDKFWEFFTIFIVWGVFPAFLLSPAPVQRMLMAPNVKVITNMYYMGALMTIPFEIMVTFLGFAAIILFPEVQSGLALPGIINGYLPAIIKGLAIAGILAVVMSTADSFLNSGAILLVHDVLKPTFKNHKLPELNLTKLATFTIGIFSMYIAINAVSIISLEVYAVTLWGPVIVIPLAAAIMGYESTPKAFLYSMATTLLSFALFSYWLPEDLAYWVGLFCIIANAISFFYFSEKFRQANFGDSTRRLMNFLSGLGGGVSQFKDLSMKLDLVSAVNKKISMIGSSHTLFGIFCCLNYIVPYFMWTHGTVNHYEFLITIRLISGLLCVGLLVEGFWPEKYRKYFGIYWYFTLCFCLPFSTTIAAFVQKFDTEWVVNMSLAIFLLALLVDWLSFLALTIFGSVAGYFFCRMFLPDLSLTANVENMSLTIYILVFSSLIGLIFSRRRDNYVDEKVNFLQKMSGMLAHEVKTPLTGVNAVREMYEDIFNNAKSTSSGQYVNLKVEKDDFEMLKKVPALLSESTAKGRVFIETFISEIENQVPESDKTVNSIQECLDEAIENFKLTKKHKGSINVKYSGWCLFYGSKKFTMHVFLNILLNAVNHGGYDVDITVTVKDNKVFIRDNGKGIEKDVLPLIFERAFSSSSSSGLGLSFCKMVMKDLGGNIKCKSKLGKFTEFELVFQALGPNEV